MEVIILAGGFGTRLSSVVSDVPKCMAPVAGHPFLFYLLKNLERFLVRKVILSVGYLRNIIFDWVEQEADCFPFSIEYAVEDTPLGTGGAIRFAMEKVSSNEVFIINGDTFFDVDLCALKKQHVNTKSELSLALKPMRNFDRFGNVLIGENNQILSFQEKKQCRDGLINGGVYLLNKSTTLFDRLPEKFSFEKEVLEPFAHSGKIFGFPFDNYFIDMGIPADYAQATKDFSILWK